MGGCGTGGGGFGLDTYTNTDTSVPSMSEDDAEELIYGIGNTLLELLVNNWEFIVGGVIILLTLTVSILSLPFIPIVVPTWLLIVDVIASMAGLIIYLLEYGIINVNEAELYYNYS